MIAPRSPRVFYPSGSPACVVHAAKRLAGDGGLAGDQDSPKADIVTGTAGALGLSPLTGRTFEIFRKDNQIWITGDRPRSVLAGALYWLHHEKRGGIPDLPMKRTSEFRDRLILEDFPFSCYGPTGFEFDSRIYAENLVALGFTSLECNRVSKHEPLEPYFDSYQPVNPSPAKFVWTRWHEGIWDAEEVAANAAELRRNIEVAQEFDLDPSVTMFLPRPYPERFFAKYPHLRGPSYEHGYLGRGGHPDVFSIDTDHADGIGFYREVFERWVEANPEILHYFFWHGDLGAQFWKDGAGPRARSRMERILEFHGLLDGIFRQHGVDPRVWINPWAMPEHTLGELNTALPRRCGYATKDAPGAISFYGTMRIRRIDATITTADIGDIAFRTRELAEKEGRETCLGQYHDFSEDLDPILGLPHPLMTYRKIVNLQAFGPVVSSVNWGILSPDLKTCRVNQDVIREMIWGAKSSCFEELMPSLLPAGLEDVRRQAVSAAWRKIDHALQIWPQYWGLRIQGLGVRLRWLVKPFLPPYLSLPESYYDRLVSRQIYRYNAPNPFREFMDLDSFQVREIVGIFTDMIGLVEDAEDLLGEAAGGRKQAWIDGQLPSVRWLRLFWTTFRNLFAFHVDAPPDCLSDEQRHWVSEEIVNTRATLAHLASQRDSLVLTDRSWGQCFGPDLDEDLRLKGEFMEELLATSGGN